MASELEAALRKHTSEPHAQPHVQPHVVVGSNTFVSGCDVKDIIVFGICSDASRVSKPLRETEFYGISDGTNGAICAPMVTLGISIVICYNNACQLKEGCPTTPPPITIMWHFSHMHTAQH